jgi:hypothetical protein
VGVDITAEVKIVNEEDMSGKRKWYATVYDKPPGCYPAAGTKLNGPAEITFHNIFPKAKDDKASFKAKLEEKIKKMEDVTFGKYDIGTGILSFLIPHW